MATDVDRFIEALVGAELMAERSALARRKQASHPRPVITVSRGLGALGKEVAAALAARLSIACHDRTLLEEVAHRANVDVDLVRSLDEHVEQAGADWWRGFVDGKLLSRETFQCHLAQVIRSISQTGGVIVGRGANEVLNGKSTLRVRIVGSLAVCAQRIALRDRCDIKSAQQRVMRINRERALYVRKLYGVNIDEASRYDLTINSDRFGVHAMVALILSALPQAIAPTGSVKNCSAPRR